MVKHIVILCLVLVMLWSCVTYQPPPPTLHIGNLPPDDVSQLSLDERLLAEDAWRSLKEGNINKARKLIERLGPESPFYYAGHGYAAYILNDLPGAREFFQASLSYHPDMILGHLGLGQIYQETGQDELAFAEYREVLKQEPEHPWAKPKYENIKKRKTEDALYDAKTLLAGGNREAGKTSYLRALYYSPQSQEAHLALAEIYIEDQQIDSALVHLKAALVNDPENPDILQMYAGALFQAEANANSLEVYEQLLERDPGNKIAQERIEVLKNRLGIFELPSQFNAIPTSEAVTKEQMSALISVKFKDILDPPATSPPIIIDISTSWAAKYIIEAASLGLLDVYPNHTFQPQKTLSRAEMAEAMNRLVSRLQRQGYRFIQQIPADRIQSSDVSPENFYYQPIVLMISYDIMGLSMGRRFHPDATVSGNEAVRLLDLILALIK